MIQFVHPWTMLCLWLLAVLPAVSQPLTRVPNTTLAFPPAPPVFGYTTENAFPSLTFTEPVCIASPPGETNRLFVIERAGRIIVVTNLAAPTRTVFLDITDRVASQTYIDSSLGLLGLAFHPGYATNRQFFVFYSHDLGGSPLNRQARLSRFEISAANTNQAVPSSEVVLLQQRDRRPEHQAGDLHFGPDGYLYVSLGDEGTQYDQLGNGQVITNNFFSAILRLDVDRRPGSLAPNPHPAIVAPTNYAVPPDNPFVGVTNFNGSNLLASMVRTEFWAIGFRNPWRMSFDPVTGWLLVGDVGQDSREEINRVVKGGNYGWSYAEGSLPGPRSNQAPANFAPLPPLVQYSHGTGPDQGNSVTGGRLYRGTRLGQLTGAYVYADYVSGNIWGLRFNGDEPVLPPERLTTDLNIGAVGQDPRNGDILFADFKEGLIKRLNYSASFVGTPLPPTLADTGAFSNLFTLAPQPGVVPYDLNAPFWSDNAIKTRWFCVPSTSQFIGFHPDGNWAMPTGMVWVKHFELVTNELTQQRVRLETRFLVRNSNGVYGLTYRWGTNATNALLVPEAGTNETFSIRQADGQTRTQVWRYPGRTECLICHSAVGGHALGFNTAQLNRNYSYPAGATNQIAALAGAGYFLAPPAAVHSLPALAAVTNDAVSVEWRVRSFLAANCRQCHQPGGIGEGFWDARFTTPTVLAGLIDGEVLNDAGDAAARLVKPLAPDQSMLLRRLRGDGVPRMPPLATSVLDSNAIALISRWITNDLAGWRSYDSWRSNYFGSTGSDAGLPGADPDADGVLNEAEYLLGRSPVLAEPAWRGQVERTSNAVAISITQPANRSVRFQFSTNTQAPFVWQFLDVPGNAPFFPASNRTARILDAETNAALRLYRAVLSAP